MSSPAINQVSGLVSSVAIKAPVKVATTANITLYGTQTIDGVAVVALDRVLVKNQTDATQNGIYDVSTTAWTRSADFDSSDDIRDGTRVNVVLGSTNTGDWAVVTADPITLGVTSLAFTSYLPGGVTAAVAAASASATAAAASAAAAAASAGTLTTVDVQIHAATSKNPLVGADEFGIWDSVSTAMRKVTFTNLVGSLGAVIAAVTGKSTPVDADGFLISDSAASNVSKFLSFTNAWANYFKAKADALYLRLATTGTITVGYTITPNALGNVGNHTVNPALGNYQYGINHAAATITAPTSDCSVEYDIVNDATAGSWTFSGFTGTNHGDTLTTTNGSAFTIIFRRNNGVSRYTVKAWQ